MFESKLFTKFDTNMECGPNPANVAHIVPLWNSDFVWMRANLQVNKINVHFVKSTERNLKKGGKDKTGQKPVLSSFFIIELSKVKKWNCLKLGIVKKKKYHSGWWEM